jgi:Ca-activated chloride channel family protein
MLRVFFAVALAVIPVTAQLGREKPIRVDVDLVNVYFSVCNSKGRLIPDLRQENFAIFEDGEPQTITNFSREAEVPLTIVMAIDTSGSVRDKLAFEQLAATEFLYATIRRGRDKAAVFTFDHVFELRQDFTDDGALLATAIGSIRAGGGTRLYDALHFVVGEKLAGTEERKIIVLITDGEDKGSRRSQREVVDLAHRNNVAIYAISMNSLGTRRPELDQSDADLELLASETGGRAYSPKKLKKLASTFKTIADELRSQYTMAYRSTNVKKDGSFRRILIETKRVRYSVRVRPGYYAPFQNAAEDN